MTPVVRPAAVHPHRRLLSALRPVARGGIARFWDLHLHRTEAMLDGPVIAACNHTGWLDGPLLAIVSPRPVHALTKQEMFHGAMGPFLRAAGQIELDRFNADPAAIKTCLRVLADGGVAGIFPEGTRGAGEYDSIHHGAAYLALLSGAPVVPVTMIGTRLPGGSSGSLPPRGARIDVVYGDAWRTEPVPWPRRREHLLETSRSLWEHLREQQRHALGLTGRTLPGPLPAGDGEAEPDTGFGHPDHPTTSPQESA